MFPFPTSELNIMLQDIWCILRLSIEGAPVLGLIDEVGRDATIIHVVGS